MSQKPKKSYAWSLLVLFLILGWIFPVIGIIALVCMAAPVVAIVSGKRKWCALFCPRGIFSDVVLARITRNKRAPAILTSNYFKLGFLIFLTANLILGIINAGGNIAAIGLVFVRLVSLTTAVAIILGYVYSQRMWCGFCPMGFLATQAIKVKRLYKTSGIRGLPGRVQDDDIVIYTGESCPACERVKGQLQDMKVAYREVNIDRDKKAREMMVVKYGKVSIPSLIVGGRLVNNQNAADLKKVLAESISRKVS